MCSTWYIEAASRDVVYRPGDGPHPCDMWGAKDHIRTETEEESSRLQHAAMVNPPSACTRRTPPTSTSKPLLNTIVKQITTTCLSQMYSCLRTAHLAEHCPNVHTEKSRVEHHLADNVQGQAERCNKHTTAHNSTVGRSTQ